MRPKLAFPNVRFGRSKIAQLKRLQTPQRSSSCDLPATRQVFARAKSTFAAPGPSTLLRGALPNVNGAGSENADVSNHRSGVRSPPDRFGSRDWSGRWAGPVPTLARSTPRLTVNGAPLCAMKIALVRHPPRIPSATPPAPRKNGNSYTPLAMNWWRWLKLDGAHSPVSSKTLRTFCGTFASDSVAPGLDASSLESDSV